MHSAIHSWETAILVEEKMDLIYYLHILIESIVVFIEVALQVCVRLLNVQRFKAAWDCIIARLGHIGNT